jgi:hypothetical protein
MLNFCILSLLCYVDFREESFSTNLFWPSLLSHRGLCRVTNFFLEHMSPEVTVYSPLSFMSPSYLVSSAWAIMGGPFLDYTAHVLCTSPGVPSVWRKVLPSLSCRLLRSILSAFPQETIADVLFSLESHADDL